MNDGGVWQILDVGSIWMKEFASALAKRHRLVAWAPVMSYAGAVQRWQRPEALLDPPLDTLRFPLQRGYARTPFRQLAGFERGLVERLRSQSGDAAAAPLVCSTPFYAPVAELWPGPVVYYVTDLTARYDGIDGRQVVALDRRMCAAAKAVCPNSARIAEYLRTEAGCAPEKITIVPNATRESNVAAAPLLAASALPAALSHLRRPVAGVIGNLASNMDWLLLEAVVRHTPELQWVFVGPATMPMREGEQARARSAVLAGAHCTGPLPYGELQTYARAFDVAVLPYRKKEPTYSGSSTRFYEHLAACRPIVATCGFAELLEKQPLVKLVSDASQMVDALQSLHQNGFHDGFETLRWQASRQGTWEKRAETLASAIAVRPRTMAGPAVALDAFASTD